MNLEKQIIALLEFLGWRLVDDGRTGRAPYQTDADYSKHGNQAIPPFTLDLMHEAEGKLTEEQFELYGNLLIEVVFPNVRTARKWRRAHIHATKEQRLEALLRTIGKWKES